MGYSQLVHDVLEGFLTAMGLYVGTNLDNLVILIVIFIAAQESNVGSWRIVAGQHLGFVVILLISTLAALGLSEVPHEVIGLLGIVPLSIGLIGFVRHFRSKVELPHAKTSIGMLSVAFMALANGGDNIATYVAALHTRDLAQSVMLETLLLAQVGPWCYLAYRISRRAKLLLSVARFDAIAVPIVLLIVGFSILATSNTIQWLLRL